MRVRSLQPYLEEEGQVRRDDVDALRGKRMGIDVSHWMFLLRLRISEPWYAGIGGVPNGMKEALDEELKELRELHIKPIFVFRGLDAVRTSVSFHTKDTRLDYARREAWEAYYRGDKETAQRQFYELSSTPLTTLPCMDFVAKYFTDHGVEFMKAPYEAYSQLATLCEANHIDCIYGAPECMLACEACDMLVTRIDWKRKLCGWINPNACFNSMGIHRSGFVDACILSGSEVLDTLPTLANAEGYKPRSWPLRGAIDMIKQFGSGRVVIDQNEADNAEYKLGFQRAKNLVDHQPMFLLDGYCIPSLLQTCPKNFSELVGPRLPPEVYFLVVSGAVSTSLINQICSGRVFDAAPSIDTQNLRELLYNLRQHRGYYLDCVSSILHHDIKTKKRYNVYWHDSTYEEELPLVGGGADELPSKPIRCLLVHPSKPILEGQQSMTTPYEIPIHALLSPYRSGVENANSAVSTLRGASTEAELVGSVLVTVLDFLGYFETPDKLNLFGEALARYDGHLFPQMLLVLELLKLQALHGDPFNIVFGLDRPSIAQEGTSEIREDDEEIALIARVFSMLPMAMSGSAWEGGVDLDLLAFQPIWRALYRSLRYMTEAVVTSLFCARKILFDPSLLVRFMSRMPYHSSAEPSTCLGIVIKHILRHPDISEDQLKTKYPSCVDPVADVKKGVDFLEGVAKLVDHLRPALSGDVWPMFMKARMLLKNKLKESELNIIRVVKKST